MEWLIEMDKSTERRAPSRPGKIRLGAARNRQPDGFARHWLY
jgi:hypothetical protein